MWRLSTLITTDEQELREAVLKHMPGGISVTVLDVVRSFCNPDYQHLAWTSDVIEMMDRLADEEPGITVRRTNHALTDEYVRFYHDLGDE
jgi:hypothetical protein